MAEKLYTVECSTHKDTFTERGGMTKDRAEELVKFANKVDPIMSLLVGSKKVCTFKVVRYKEVKEPEKDVLTAGQEAMGVDFNPSGNDDVNTVKQLMAQVFDIVERSVPADDGTIPTARKRKMRDAALEQVITAQMWAVKVITLNK